eukprot:scaffold196931_cov17-Tisochrysis_lutea.AAC.1
MQSQKQRGKLLRMYSDNQPCRSHGPASNLRLFKGLPAAGAGPALDGYGRGKGRRRCGIMQLEEGSIRGSI